MKTPFVITASLLALTAFTGVAMAQEVGRVISSTPLVQQVGVPRQVCTNQPVAVNSPKTGAGAMMGAVAGGAMGNAVGQGGGKALATIVGVMGGAILGNNVEGPNTQVQNVQQCSTQTFYENRTMGYNVVYEYGGKQYTVQMQSDPGPTVQLQVTPVGAANSPQQQPNGNGNYSNGGYNNGTSYPGQVGQPPLQAPVQGTGVNQPMTYVQPDMTQNLAQPVLTSSTTYVVPAYTSIPSYPSYYGSYYGGYYPPVGISLGFGYRGGYYYGGGRHHRR